MQELLRPRMGTKKGPLGPGVFVALQVRLNCLSAPNRYRQVQFFARFIELVIQLGLHRDADDASAIRSESHGWLVDE